MLNELVGPIDKVFHIGFVCMPSVMLTPGEFAIQKAIVNAIIVEDNGQGMQKKDITRGFGFSTIQSKVNLLKGSFAIEGQPGKGTMVLVDLPV